MYVTLCIFAFKLIHSLGRNSINFIIFNLQNTHTSNGYTVIHHFVKDLSSAMHRQHNIQLAEQFSHNKAEQTESLKKLEVAFEGFFSLYTKPLFFFHQVNRFICVNFRFALFIASHLVSLLLLLSLHFLVRCFHGDFMKTVFSLI